MNGKRMNSQERHLCWSKRDLFLENCLQNDDKTKSAKCKQLMEEFQAACPQSWVYIMFGYIAYKELELKRTKRDKISQYQQLLGEVRKLKPDMPDVSIPEPTA